MRKISLIIIASVIFGFGQQLNAQEFKFGHIEREELIVSLPDYDTAVARLERLSRDLSNALEIMQVEFNNKFYNYEREAANLLDVVRQDREQELQNLNNRIQEFQQTAQQQWQERNAELFQPIVERVDRAIRDVGRENGFTYIFVVGQGSTVGYFDEVRSIDVSSLVRTKLGVR